MWIGRAKMERWGPGAAISGRKELANVCESAERRKARARTGQLGGVVLMLQSAALSKDVLLLCNNKAVLCTIKKWVGQGGRATLATETDTDIIREIVLPANTMCASRESYFSEKGEVALWRTNQQSS